MNVPSNGEATGIDAASGSTEFLRLLESRERGKLKVYIGSFAGVGKTYRMLQEGNALRARRSAGRRTRAHERAGWPPHETLAGRRGPTRCRYKRHQRSEHTAHRITQRCRSGDVGSDRA